MTNRISRTLVLGLVVIATVGQAEEQVDQFTASPERRAELLAKVRSDDRAWVDKKRKGPVVTIVKDGNPNATIVCAGNGKMRPAHAKGDMRAALLLQTWIELMSGAKLPIAPESPAEGVAIFVGQSAVDAGCKVSDIESRSREGIRVRCDGKHVYIAAQSSAATTRAVGRFLENEFGAY